MVVYYGTPIGGDGVEIARFLKGRHALVSFANQQDMAVVAGVCSSWVLDNGAFTMWKGGKAPDWDEYYRWVADWATHPGFDWHLIPDVIDGTEDDNWRLMFHYHHEAAKFSGVPVYHMHESLQHLERLVTNYPRIAIGSSGEWPTPGTPSWWARMAEVMSVVCDPNGRPRCRLHGLRMAAPSVFTLLPLSSADSCNAGRNNGDTDRWHGSYKPYTRAQRSEVIAWRTEHFQSAPEWDVFKIMQKIRR